jgi:hypothetical protein
MAARVIANVSTERAQWTVNHVRAEAQRLRRYGGHRGDRRLIDRVVSAALGEHSIALTTHADTEMDEPAVLRRRDGSSVYTRHDSTVYTSTAIIAAERRILDAAERHDGRIVDDNSIGLALLEQHAQRGITLNDGQVQLVRQMATSGARLQLALAPAGTGKTTAMAALSCAWRNSGGTVIGLAPTAAAAEVLAAETGVQCDTVAKLVQLAEPPARRRKGAALPPRDPAKKWFNAIGPNTLIIVDEAGMASTLDLDAVRNVAESRGASVRLVGDDHQLASISAGGILRDLSHRAETVTLSTVVRFTDAETGRAEGAASLALRAGDPAAIGFYIDNHRVHVGAAATVNDVAYRAWAADLATGHDTILLAPTNELVAELNERARLDLLGPNPPRPSATITLGDGLAASAGDLITTRKNARWLGRRTWVKNGHRWVIRSVNKDGSLTVLPRRGRETGRPIRLPADYVRDHTTLGYASTIDAAEGITAGGRGPKGTCHVVGSDQLTRQQLYVALTRGSTANHVYFPTAEADPHLAVARKAILPPTAVDIMETILRHDGAQVSAHSVMAADTDPTVRLATASSMYADAVTSAAAEHAGSEVMADIDAAAAAIRIDLLEYQAWPVLRRHLAMLAIDGHDPVDALDRAAALGPLDNAWDPAAILDWRLERPIGSALERVGPLEWSPAIPEALTDHSTWGPYVTKRAQLVSDLADEVRDIARGWHHTNAPAWARPLVGGDAHLLAEVAVFRAAHGVDPADTRVTGPQQYPGRSAAVQALIHTKLGAELTRDHPAIKRWKGLAAQFDPRVPADLHWPQLAVNLDDAAKAGADVADLLRVAMARAPLPDEKPAAALWWRLAPILTSVIPGRPQHRSATRLDPGTACPVR